MNATAERHSLDADAWQTLMGQHAANCRNGKCPRANPKLKHDDIAEEVRSQCTEANEPDDDARLLHRLANTCPGRCALP